MKCYLPRVRSIRRRHAKYDADDERFGHWGGYPFVNLVANASAEHAWPRPRASIDDRFRALARHRPSEIFLSLIDLERNGKLLATWAAPLAVDEIVDRMAWGQVRLGHPIAVWVLRGFIGVALVGYIIWMSGSAGRMPARLRAALMFSALAAMLIWGATILRPLPALAPVINIPATRYAFPAIVPTILVLLGGWLAVARRPEAVAVVVGAALVLNVISILTLRAFFGAG